MRAARFQDIPEIKAMLREMQAASKYAGRVAIAEKAMDRVIEGLLAGQNQNGPQGSFLAVAEEGGRIVGFMGGVLDRVYHIGDRLVANDAYLYVRPGAAAKQTLQLVDAYISWARGIRAVIEIKLSWTDTLPGAERIEALYRRKGFHRVGGIFEMRCGAPAEQEAA